MNISKIEVVNNLTFQQFRKRIFLHQLNILKFPASQGLKKYLQDYLKKLGENTRCYSCSCSNAKEAITIKSRIKDAFIYAKDLIQKIWLFILLGVGMGAFLHGYVPQEFFMKYMGDNNLFAVPLAVMAGIPLYADATTIIPVAQVLIQKGASVQF